MRVLLIDDDPDLRPVMASVLAAHGHDVVEAADARTAREAALARMPDAVILDLILPDCSRFSLIRWLRSLPGGDAVRAVAISAFPDALDEARAQRVGFDDFVEKPCDPDDLARAVAGGAR